MANRLWCSDFLTPPTPSCLPRISYATQKLMIDSWKMLQKQSEAFHTFLWHFFFKFKTECLLHIVLLNCPHVQIAFLTFTSRVYSNCRVYSPVWCIPISRVYSNCCCSCSFEAEIIKIGQSSHKMCSNNILNFEGSMTILKDSTKKSGNLLKALRTCVKQDLTLNNQQWLICL